MVQDDDRKDDFAIRRQKARENSQLIQAQAEADGRPTDWFEGLYKAANGDIAAVPWADNIPHPGLANWLEKAPIALKGRAADVGCGLGDNALALKKSGFDVTAFDLSKTAIEWAKERYGTEGIDFVQADLFDLPKQWQGAFDFVHETYTVQALKGDLRKKSLQAVAELVKPGGHLLLICRSRENGAEASGPPWPLSRNELATLEDSGLEVVEFEEFEVEKKQVIPHFRVLYRAPA